MKFHRYDLEENPFVIDTVLEVSEEDRKPNTRYSDISDIEVSGTGFYEEETEELIIGLDIFCQVEVPCAITLKPIELDLEIQYSETFSFLEGEETVYIEGDEIDLTPYIWSAVIAEIPIKVVDPELKEYPSGDGWQVLTEEDFEKTEVDKIDPRLEKLKEFKFDE